MFFKLKLSTIMFIILGLFIVVSFFGYFTIKQQLSLNHLKEETILFANIKNSSSDLLSKLLYKFSKQKDILESKHHLALAYIKEHGVDANLTNLHKKLNQNLASNPYNIYITDDNYVIQNSTFAPDIGFDLSFAKGLFDTHKAQKQIGVSAPIFETLSMNFNSYSDSYLPYPNDKKILQVSYTYEKEINENLTAVQNLIEQHPHIKDVKAYILFSDGYVGDFLFKSFKPYKPTLEEVKKRMATGEKLADEMSFNEIVAPLIIDGEVDRYKAVYIAQQSPIFDDAKIIYEVVFDDYDYNQKLEYLLLGVFLVTFFGIFGILAIFKIRFKEEIFKQNKNFIQHSIHEIKTPLSIITLNTQLRTKKYGKDEFSDDIDSALKVLKNSYDDMSFALTSKKYDYPVSPLVLGEFVFKRVEYFQSIAQSYGKNIILQCDSNCKVTISEIELIRLIDNNLSNGIKYSKIGTDIEVKLLENHLTFQTKSDKIEDVEGIFWKYNRQTNEDDGLGLGLGIVYDIAEKYGILIEVQSEDLTLFSYKFPCHEGK